MGIKIDKVDTVGYNPYPPQQPTYDPYQQQYQQQYPQAYQQPYPASGVAPSQPTPPRKPWTTMKVVIVVVVVVVVILVVLAVMSLMLLFYMQSFTSGPGLPNTPAVSMDQKSFTNPTPSQTVNGGGWQVRVVAISGTASLSAITVNIKSSGTTTKSLSAVSTSKSDLSYTVATMDWYLLKGGGSLKFVDGSTVKNLDSSTAKDLGAGEFETVQGSTLVVLDTDGSGTLSAADLVYVYSDTDGSGSSDIESGDQLVLSMAGVNMGSVNLY